MEAWNAFLKRFATQRTDCQISSIISSSSRARTRIFAWAYLSWSNSLCTHNCAPLSRIFVHSSQIRADTTISTTRQQPEMRKKSDCKNIPTTKMRLSWSSQRQKLLFHGNGRAFNTEDCRGNSSLQLRPPLNCKMRLWQLWAQSIWRLLPANAWGVIKKLLNTFWVAFSTPSSFFKGLNAATVSCLKIHSKNHYGSFTAVFQLAEECYSGRSLNEIFTWNSFQAHHHHFYFFFFFFFSSITCLVIVWFQLLWKK